MSGNDSGNSEVETTVESYESFDQRDKEITTLVNNQDVLVDNSEDLKQSFESFFSSNLEFNDLGKHWNHMNVVLMPEFDDIDDLADTANSLINIIQHLDAEVIELLNKEGADEDLIALLKDLKLDYGHELDRQFNRLQKGRNWWSNIKTNTGFRSQRPNFQHELTIDYSETVVFNSDIQTTFILVDHFMKQLQSVPELVGDDALLEMDTDQIDSIIERLEDLKTDIQDYEEEIEEISEDSIEDSDETIADNEQSE